MLIPKLSFCCRPHLLSHPSPSSWNILIIPQDNCKCLIIFKVPHSLEEVDFVYLNYNPSIFEYPLPKVMGRYGGEPFCRPCFETKSGLSLGSTLMAHSISWSNFGSPVWCDVLIANVKKTSSCDFLTRDQKLLHL